MIRRVWEHVGSTSRVAVLGLLTGAALSVACAQPAGPSALAALSDVSSVPPAGPPAVVALGEIPSAAAAIAATPGVTPADLVARGWTCITPPTPNRIVCSHPKQGVPVFGNPPPEDRPASYSLWMFDGAGNFIGPYTLLRSDLYQGQPCDGSGEPWIHRPPVGYYECVHRIGQ